MRFSHIAAAGLGVALMASAANGSLLQNGGFEDGFNNWVNFGNTFIEPGFDGNAMKAFGTFDAPFNFSGAFQDVGVSAGTEYTMTAEAMTFSVDSIFGTQNEGRMAIDWFDGGGAYMYSDSIGFIDGTSAEDTVITGSFNAVAPAGVGFARVVIGILQPDFEGGSIFFDNVSLRAVPAPGALALLGLAGFAGRRRRR